MVARNSYHSGGMNVCMAGRDETAKKQVLTAEMLALDEPRAWFHCLCLSLWQVKDNEWSEYYTTHSTRGKKK